MTREDWFGAALVVVVLAGLVLVRSHAPVCADLPGRVEVLERKVGIRGAATSSRKGSGFVGKLGKDAP